MKRLLQISALTLTLAGGYVATAAVAGPGAPADAQTMVDRLTEKLGLDEGTAQDVASTLQSSREQKKAIRSTVKTEAQALKAALEAGDKKGMRRSMDNLAAAKDEMRELKEQTADRIKAQLTVEQQAKWTLHQMRKKRRAQKARRDRRANPNTQ